VVNKKQRTFGRQKSLLSRKKGKIGAVEEGVDCAEIKRGGNRSDGSDINREKHTHSTGRQREGSPIMEKNTEVDGKSKKGKKLKNKKKGN